MLPSTETTERYQKSLVQPHFEISKRCAAHAASIKKYVEHDINRVVQFSTRGKPMAMLSCCKGTLVPDAIPLFSGETEDIMALVFGEAKKNSHLRIMYKYNVPVRRGTYLTVARPSQPQARTSSPWASFIPLEPTLSEK